MNFIALIAYITINVPIETLSINAPYEGLAINDPIEGLSTDKPTEGTPEDRFADTLNGCSFKFPPRYGSIDGISYQDRLAVNENRFKCQKKRNKGLYWYPQWMGAPPHHPYPRAGELEQPPASAGPYYPHNSRRLLPTGHSKHVPRALRLKRAP